MKYKGAAKRNPDQERSREFLELLKIVIRDIMETTGITKVEDAADRLEEMERTLKDAADLFDGHSAVCGEMAKAIRRAAK